MFRYILTDPSQDIWQELTELTTSAPNNMELGDFDDDDEIMGHLVDLYPEYVFGYLGSETRDAENLVVVYVYQIM